MPAPSLSKGALARIAQGIGWAVLGALAAAGLALAALTAYAGLSPSGSVVSSLVTREVGALLAGRLTIQGLALLSRGGIEVRGLELRDPDGHVVLAAPRARVFADVTGLARGWLGLVVEVDSPSVLLATEADGGLSIARAFASPRPAREGAAAPSAPGGKGLAVEVRRLTARDGTFRWLQRDGSTALAAAGLDLRRFYVVRCRDPQDALWAYEQALRAPECGAAFAWLGARDERLLRRLQVAAREGRTWGVLWRRPGQPGGALAAPLRLALASAGGGGRLAVRVLKRRGAELPQPVTVDLRGCAAVMH